MAAAGPLLREAPATVAGLFRVPCDPLVLAVGGGVNASATVEGLTALVDWRMAGRLTQHLRARAPGDEVPLLLPRTPLLPAGRLLLVRREPSGLAALAACVRALAVRPVGLCPEDFGWTPAQVVAAFGNLPLVLYRSETAVEGRDP